MKATLYRNIDLVRIPIKAGISEYYFPQNVDWAGCKVDKIVACIPTAACVDPMDGTTPVLNMGAATDLYFNIVSAGQKELMHSVSAEQIVHTNNHPILLDSVLDLGMCNLYFTTPPVANATLLLYVYHDNKDVQDYDMPERSVTVEFDLAAGEEINFEKIITSYIHELPATVKGISIWSAGSNPAYLTLRDKTETYVLRNLHCELARPQMNLGSAELTQLKPMLFDDIDIDFQYSHIRNCSSSTNHEKITLIY